MPPSRRSRRRGEGGGSRRRDLRMLVGEEPFDISAAKTQRAAAARSADGGEIAVACPS